MGKILLGKEGEVSLREGLESAIEGLVSRRKRPEELEGIISEAKSLAREWKNPFSAKEVRDWQPLFGESYNSTTYLLAALVVELKRDYEFVEPIRRCFPRELEELRDAAKHAELRELVEAFASSQPKRERKEEYEWTTRRLRRRNYCNSIEYQFGGEGEEVWRKSVNPLWGTSTMFGTYTREYKPDCLDEVFRGHPVSMWKFEELFGFGRHQLVARHTRLFKRELPCLGKGYGAHAAVELFDALLSEGSSRMREGCTGRPRRSWILEASVRARVLSGVAARAESVCLSKEIAGAFADVTGRHMP
jgi:hypothetical protein